VHITEEKRVIFRAELASHQQKGEEDNSNTLGNSNDQQQVIESLILASNIDLSLVIVFHLSTFCLTFPAYKLFGLVKRLNNWHSKLLSKSFNDYIDNFNFKMDSLSTAINLTNK
jgi:hypothetical protein